MIAGTTTVRFWAAARDAAGCPEEMVPAGPVDRVLARLTERHGSGLARILESSLVLIDGVALDRSVATTIESGALLEVLPPFAGG